MSAFDATDRPRGGGPIQTELDRIERETVELCQRFAPRASARLPAPERHIARSDARVAAYEAIDSERDYQDERWGGPLHDREHSPAEFILYMEEYLARARVLATESGQGELATLHAIRKVGALAVACLEVKGAPRRG